MLTAVTTFEWPLKVILGSASSIDPLIGYILVSNSGNNHCLKHYFLIVLPSLPVVLCKFQILTVPSSDPDAAIISFGWKQTVLTESKCLFPKSVFSKCSQSIHIYPLIVTLGFQILGCANC